MLYTATIPSPDRSHYLRVVYEAIDICEDEYKASIAVRIIDVETGYDEEGNEISTDWLDLDYLNIKI
jgi:hypothetical protein